MHVATFFGDITDREHCMYFNRSHPASSMILYNYASHGCLCLSHKKHMIHTLLTALWFNMVDARPAVRCSLQGTSRSPIPGKARRQLDPDQPPPWERLHASPRRLLSLTGPLSESFVILSSAYMQAFANTSIHGSCVLRTSCKLLSKAHI